MWHDVKNIFHFIIVFQCFIFIAYLLLHKNKGEKSNIFFIVFLISIIIVEVGGIAVHFLSLSDVISAYFPQLHYILYPFNYIFIPLLFIYELSITKAGFKFSKLHYLHFLLFFIIFCVMLFKYITADPELLRSYLKAERFAGALEKQIYNIVEIVQFIAYSIPLFITINSYEERIKNYFSSIEKINLSWIKLIVYGFIAWQFLLLVDYVLWLYFQSLISRNIYYLLYISAQIVFLLLVSTMFFKGLKQPRVFFAVNGNDTNQKYKNIMLGDEKIEEYKEKLIGYMQKEKPYLRPSFNLNELARDTDIPSHHLSLLLNVELKLNFYDFINFYRLEESKKILSDKSSFNKTILEILYETGFNSKSVFNTVFKKHTGMTPTQFRKLHNPS